MANHLLSLEVPETLNTCVLPIFDTSTYSASNTIDCPLLEITPPGYNSPKQITSPTIAPGFYQAFNACSLGIQTANCGSKNMALPDGIYIIKYSVSPNDIVYVEYNHLRMTCALNKVQAVYCSLDLGACEPSDKISAQLEQIRMIQSYLKAAKSYVEFCHEPGKGMDLYRYAVKLLDKMDCSACKTC